MFKTETLPRIAFEEVYDRFYQAIFNYILGRTANIAETEDLTAQTFYQALAHFHKVADKPDVISSWLYRIATNEVNNWFRKRKRGSLQAIPTADHKLQELQDTELQSAEAELQRHRVFVELNGVLRQLKLEDQTLIALRYFEQKSFAEIAEILRKREGTLVMRTHRALQKLKAALEQRGINHERFRESFRASQADYRGGELPAQSAS